jgi:hypothetical protein
VARNSTKLPRDEIPLEEVEVAKRQLLSWAELRLQSFDRQVAPEDLTRTVSEELHNALKSAPAADDSNQLGSLDVSFSRPQGAPARLQMTTDVGIPCGPDLSVYLYEWNGSRWNRRFALEAGDYRPSRYTPEGSVELLVSSPDPHGARLVLATGWPPACMSVWHTLFVKLFRIGTSQTLLLQQTPLAHQEEEPAYSARLEPGGALIEFSGRSLDSSILIRKYVLHYKIDHDRVDRIEPIALSVRDFAEEWLTRPWTEIAMWSNPQLLERHNRLSKETIVGEFDAAQRCAKSGEWQVSIDLDGTRRYFSILERTGYRFTMLRISNRPRPDCSGPNEIMNLGDSTLFVKN